MRYWICWCLVVLPACAVHAQVVLPPIVGDHGVQYAAEALGQVTKARVTALVAATQGGPEAYDIMPEGTGYRVRAGTPTGLMYGLLELRDRLRFGPTVTAIVHGQPALRVRGYDLDFPFYLGVNLYEGRWRNAQATERRSDNWWLDKGHWAWRLKRCADTRVNALLICHPHPFPALIDLPDLPEAAYFPPEHLQRLQEHFRWLLAEAAQYGVKVYFLTWNIWVSPGFAKAHKIAQEGPDSELVRAYTRRCYRRLFETYPALAGVVTIPGEAPPGCTDFVRDAIAAPLSSLPAPPEFIYWLWCAYPEDARPVLASYKGKALAMHYLQYEQLFRPQADPRIKRTSEALGGVRMLTLGGLGAATGWYYWSDPYYIRDILADLPRQAGDGVFFSGLDSFDWVAPKWLAWQGFGRYVWDPHSGAEDGYWKARIAEHYGLNEAQAADFLSGSVAASAVTTRMLALLHRQTSNYHPQFGLPLTHYLGLPTLSTYVFENHERLDAQGRLSPRLGLTWPNPDWGEKVVGVVDYVAGKRDGTTPDRIADELDRYGATVLAAVGRLRAAADSVHGGKEKWLTCMDMMEMNGHLGVHVAAKIRAAIAWEQWRRHSGAPDRILEPLGRSVLAFQKLAEVAGRVYGSMDIYHYRSGISRPWPWTNLQIWNLDRFRKQSFAETAAMFERELDWVRSELAASRPVPLLPFEDDLQAKPANARRLIHWDYQGEPPSGIKLNSIPPSAVVTTESTDAIAPISGAHLVADHHADGFWFPLDTDPARLPLKIGKTYWVAMDYRIVRTADSLGEWLSAGARTTEGGWQKDIGARYMGGPDGTRGRITVRFSPSMWKDYYFYVSIHGSAKVELDNLEIWEGN